MIVHRRGRLRCRGRRHALPSGEVERHGRLTLIGQVSVQDSTLLPYPPCVFVTCSGGLCCFPFTLQASVGEASRGRLCSWRSSMARVRASLSDMNFPKTPLRRSARCATTWLIVRKDGFTRVNGRHAAPVVHTNLNSPEYISTTDNRAGSRHQQSHSHISVNVISR